MDVGHLSNQRGHKLYLQCSFSKTDAIPVRMKRPAVVYDLHRTPVRPAVYFAGRGVCRLGPGGARRAGRAAGHTRTSIITPAVARRVAGRFVPITRGRARGASSRPPHHAVLADAAWETTPGATAPTQPVSHVLAILNRGFLLRPEIVFALRRYRWLVRCCRSRLRCGLLQRLPPRHRYCAARASPS